MGPEVSVVITCYRGGKFLAEAIDSVLSQTFRDFEIVLVDNNANEETRDVMRRYLDNCPNVIRSVLQPEQGAPSARNMGILESRGTFISLLDDDDFMYPKKLERQYRMAQSSPEASLIGCGVNYFESESGRILLENVLGGYGTLWGIRENLFKKLFLLRMDERQAQSFFFALPSTMFFRKETATSAGLFDVIMNPSTAEDIEFCTRMIERGSFLLVPEPLAGYRVLSPSSTTRSNISKVSLFPYAQDEKFLNLLFKRYRSLPSSEIIIREILSHYIQTAGLDFIRNLHTTFIGRVLIWRAFLLNPSNDSYRKSAIKSMFPKHYLKKLFWFEQFNTQDHGSDITWSTGFSLYSSPLDNMS